ncbi:MAG: glycosyltransferase [Candidatus Poseidoniaceae archaeon]
MGRVVMLVTNACAPDPRVLRQARWLVEAGHEVTVHAFDRAEEHAPLEDMVGVRVVRHHLGPHPYGASFATLRGLRRFRQSALRACDDTAIDVVVCHDADTLPLARPLKKKGVATVFDMHDLRHTWAKIGAPHRLDRRLASRWLEQRTRQGLPHADLIVTTSGEAKEGGKPGLQQQVEAWGRDAFVLENRPDPGTFRTAVPDSTWRVACLGRVRDLATVDLVIRTLLTMPEAQRPVLRWAGDGVAADEARQRLERSDLVVEFEGGFGHDDLDRLHDGVDVALALYDPSRGNIADGALPVRMFEAAVRGVPSVVNADVLMAELADVEGFGVPCTWNDADALVAALHDARGLTVPEDAGRMAEGMRAAWLEAIEQLMV